MSAGTAPLREALEEALPERPFRIELWDGTELPSVERRPDVHAALAGGARPRAARARASSASAART